LVFLLWVWWDSGKYESVARWFEGWAVKELRVVSGGVEWERSNYTRTGVPLTAAKSFEVDRSEVDSDRGWVSFAPEQVEVEERVRGFDFREAFVWKVVVPHGQSLIEVRTYSLALWVVVACYVEVWLGAVWWRQRRKMKRMMREMEVVA